MSHRVPRVSFLMCPFCVRVLFPVVATRRDHVEGVVAEPAVRP